MTLAITTVSSPKYSKSDNSVIDCMITLSDGSVHPYSSEANDPAPYGAVLWAALNAGAYGTIGAYVAPVLTPQQQAALALNVGINLTSTGTPALNGNYPTNAAAMNQINALVTFILVNSAFPNGLTELPWYDSAMAAHMFPDVTTFKNFATAFANFVASVQIYANSNGTIGSIPNNNITIP